MFFPILLACAGASPTDSGFPDWLRDRKPAQTKAAKPEIVGAPNRDLDGWIVVQEHPALARDSTSVVEVAGNRVAAALLWPFDNVVRPTLRYALEPVRSAVDYSEETRVIDRGIRLTHPTGSEDVWFYPVTTVDGTESSRWGLVFLDENLRETGWRMRLAGAWNVAQDPSASAQLRSASYTPLELVGSTIFSAGRWSAVAIRAPDETKLTDRTATGQVREDRVQWSGSLWSKGPVPRSRIGITYDRVWHDVGVPSRWDQELPADLASIRWFRAGDRGTRGEEVDHFVSLGMSWSDQNMAGAPTSGGPVWARVWRGWAEGGGDLAGVDVSATRCFLLGDERYVYRKEDLRPYVELDPREIIKILDPTTLRERLTQRKILIVSARYIHVEELDPANPVSYFNMPSLGGDAPARGYPSSFLSDHTVAGLSLEYRWPIWKYVDGVSFAELAWSSPAPWLKDAQRLAPGAGAGFRARLDRLFLFRGYLAWGRSGSTYALTTTSEF